MKVKNPVQRAGVRLLWAAAIPVQCQVRSFLARQHAIRRMCAVLTIQSVSRIYCSHLVIFFIGTSSHFYLLNAILSVCTTMER